MPEVIYGAIRQLISNSGKSSGVGPGDYSVNSKKKMAALHSTKNVAAYHLFNYTSEVELLK